VTVAAARDLPELMRTRRAVRRFRAGEIPEADVREVLEAARWAPSPANLQPQRFIRVRDRALKEALQELAREGFATRVGRVYVLGVAPAELAGR
jgi:nitroreductase